eukprot:TRINITY_DN7867_c0_g1_i4.p1 TRINITY_DN7867_c0_g1~~TRINITY_DN7867_c0_g1_i4.p1  ORF type:complete len:243 (-),score=39.88 TRINITY_DN7867_c0_g1_i4:22-750(-)
MSMCAISCLAMFFTDSDAVTQLAIDAGIVPKLFSLLYSKEIKKRKHAVWALSNIAAGTITQLQVVIDVKAMERIMELFMNDVEEVKRECVWVLSNAVITSDFKQLQYLLNIGVTESLCSVLSTKQLRVLYTALGGIHSMLRMSDSSNEVKERIKRCGGLDALENLQENENQCVYLKVVEIIEMFFDTEDSFGMDDIPSIFDSYCLSTLSRIYVLLTTTVLSLIHICRCRRIERCRSRWSPYH